MVVGDVEQGPAARVRKSRRGRDIALCVTVGALMAVQVTRLLLVVEQGREGRALAEYRSQVERGVALHARGIPTDRATYYLSCLAALPENGGIPGEILIAREWLAGKLGTESGPGFPEMLREYCGAVGGRNGLSI